MKWLVVLFTLASTANAVASAEHRSALVAANPSLAEQTCAYRVARVNKDGDQRVEWFDGEWTLESVNGAPPDKDTLDDYADGKEQREERNGPASMALEKLIVPGTLALVEENEEFKRFTFEVAPDKEKDAEFVKQMQASLWAAPDYRVTRFRMKNDKPVSPQTGVKISHFDQDMRFVWNDELRAVVLDELSVSIKGRAFLVKKIERELNLRFSDISCRSGL